jgi:hypothetical protein
MMEAVSTSETSVSFYETTRHNIPEDSHLLVMLIVQSAQCKPEFSFVNTFCATRAILHTQVWACSKDGRSRPNNRPTDRDKENVDGDNTVPYGV